jgi:hypothetical protein
VQPPPVPRYGEASLADLVPALLAAGQADPAGPPAGQPSQVDGEPGHGGQLGEVGQADYAGHPAPAGPARLTGLNGLAGVLAPGWVHSVCLLLVDSLGDDLLGAHADVAPFLAGHRAGALTVGFPSTTATSVASIGTGRPPGEHGVVGYQWAVDTDAGERVLNALRWTLAGAAGSAVEAVVPEQAQPQPTAFERAGVPVTIVAPGYQRGSGLSRAVLRGGRFVVAPTWGVLVAAVAAAMREPGLVYAYVSELDTTGHVLGPGTPGWRFQLGLVDRLVATIADQLPAGALLAVTGDHGMVPIRPEDRVDLDQTPELLDGVRALGGEPRARYAYSRPGAAGDVLGAWRELLGGRMWVVSGEDAVAAGWYGPAAAVSDRVRRRIGDVVAAAADGIALVRSAAEPTAATLAGHHGSLTPAEQLVPLVLFRSGG